MRLFGPDTLTTALIQLFKKGFGMEEPVFNKNWIQTVDGGGDR